MAECSQREQDFLDGMATMISVLKMDIGLVEAIAHATWNGDAGFFYTDAQARDWIEALVRRRFNDKA